MEHKLNPSFAYPGDDLLDHDAQDALAHFAGRRGMAPHLWQVGAQREQRLALLRCDSGCLLGNQRVYRFLTLRHQRQSFIPSPLKLARHKPVAPVHGIELSLSTGGFETSLFQSKFELPSLGPAVVGSLLDRAQCSLKADGP